MGLLASLLLLLGVLWLVQLAGTFFQMRHYREVLGGITRDGERGYVGTGNAKARFGKGVVAILVSDDEGVITRALRMRGISVFARFQEVPDLVGMSLDELRDEAREEPYDKTTLTAARRAVEQIDHVTTERREVKTPG